MEAAAAGMSVELALQKLCIGKHWIVVSWSLARYQWIVGSWSLPGAFITRCVQESREGLLAGWERLRFMLLWQIAATVDEYRYS